MIEYLTGATFSKKPVARRGMGLASGQNQSGYGNKISTDYMAHKGNKTYRVYAICHSNVASHYILLKGKRLFINDITL